MNIFEVGKKENIGKEYNVYRRGICIGKWTIRRIATSNKFEFYNKKNERMSDLYYTSQMLEMEFEEISEWSKVPVDTLVEVSDDGRTFFKRYFAKYESGTIFTWSDVRSSKTAYNKNDVVRWKIANIIRE